MISIKIQQNTRLCSIRPFNFEGSLFQRILDKNIEGFVMIVKFVNPKSNNDNGIGRICGVTFGLTK